MSVDDATEWLSVVEWHALKAFVRQSRHQTKYVNALNGTTQAAIDRALSDVLGIADTGAGHARRPRQAPAEAR